LQPYRMQRRGLDSSRGTFTLRLASNYAPEKFHRFCRDKSGTPTCSTTPNRNPLCPFKFAQAYTDICLLLDEVKLEIPPQYHNMRHGMEWSSLEPKRRASLISVVSPPMAGRNSIDLAPARSSAGIKRIDTRTLPPCAGCYTCMRSRLNTGTNKPVVMGPQNSKRTSSIMLHIVRGRLVSTNQNAIPYLPKVMRYPFFILLDLLLHVLSVVCRISLY
jgi:hypothetical protein